MKVDFLSEDDKKDFIKILIFFQAQNKEIEKRQLVYQNLVISSKITYGCTTIYDKKSGLIVWEFISSSLGFRPTLDFTYSNSYASFERKLIDLTKYFLYTDWEDMLSLDLKDYLFVDTRNLKKLNKISFNGIGKRMIQCIKHLSKEIDNHNL